MGRASINSLEHQAVQLRGDLNDSLFSLNAGVRDFNQALGESIPEAQTFGGGDLDSVSLQETRNALRAASDRHYTEGGNYRSSAANNLTYALNQIQRADIRLDDAFPETRTGNTVQQASDDILGLTTAFRGYSQAEAIDFSERDLESANLMLQYAQDDLHSYDSTGYI
jgi:hypothetical protein